MTRIVAVLALTFIASTAQAQVEIKYLQDAYDACLNSAFLGGHIGISFDHPEAAVERSFADCQTEENAWFTNLANILHAYSLDTAPVNQAVLDARAIVDRHKARLKRLLLKDAISASPQRP